MIVLINTVCPEAEGGCGRNLVLATVSGRANQVVPAPCKCGKYWTVHVDHIKTIDNSLNNKVQSIDQLTFTCDLTVFDQRE
jgi:hypothetical protein